jgi:hypothetical protein
VLKKEASGVMIKTGVYPRFFMAVNRGGGSFAALAGFAPVLITPWGSPGGTNAFRNVGTQ